MTLRLFLASLGLALSVGACSSAPPLLIEDKLSKTKNNVEQPRIEHVLFFEFNSSELPNTAGDILRPHSDYLIANPHETVLVQGFADEVGSTDFNHMLGLKRAKTVAEILLSHGVSPRQLIVRSASEIKPLDPNPSQGPNARNRRVALYY